jgi:hypothetical protein
MHFESYAGILNLTQGRNDRSPTSDISCMFESAHEQPSIRKVLRRRLRQLRGVDKWPIAEAKILCCDWVIEPGGESGEYEVQFIFNFAGVSYYGGFSLSGGRSERLFATGDTIQIQYNPKNPDQSLYSEAWSKGETYCIWIGVICLLFFGHWLITGSPWFTFSTKGD